MKKIIALLIVAAALAHFANAATTGAKGAIVAHHEQLANV